MIARLTFRSSAGNMLPMTALVGGLLLLAFVAAFTLYMMFAERDRGQAESERLSMQLAGLLNDNDRVGRMNTLLVRNRELVYLSRQNLTNATGSGMELWTPLAERLYSEARASQATVDTERRKQIERSEFNIQSEFQKERKHGDRLLPLVLPGWKTGQAELSEVALGCVQHVQSNVQAVTVYPELLQHDTGKKYLESGSLLYMGNINAKLPAPDDDLVYNLSAISAPVDNVISPARLINQESFKQTTRLTDNGKHFDQKIEFLPSAVEIVRIVPMSVATGDKRWVRETATAASTGAGLLNSGHD